MRTPLGGRTFEAYGEDPFLVARIGRRLDPGAQAQGVIADVKHFAGQQPGGLRRPAANRAGPASRSAVRRPQGNRMHGRTRTSTSARCARSTCRSSRRRCKEGGVGTVMCSYNKLNGAYACENAPLLDRRPARDWGFKGFVLADYGAAHDTAASLNNGLDFEPWPGATPTAPTPVGAALATGQLTRPTVDEHVRRILRTLFAFGFFDRPAFPDDDAQIDQRRARSQRAGDRGGRDHAARATDAERSRCEPTACDRSR